MALPWSLDAAARGRVLFAASPDGSGHHFKPYLPGWEVSPPLQSWQLRWWLLTSPWGHHLLPTATLFLPPQFQILTCPFFREDSFVLCITTGDLAAVTFRGWKM